MSELWNLLPEGGWSRFACDLLWQSTLVGLLVWCVVRPLANRPAVRAWLLLLAMVCCVAMPAASAAVRAAGYGLWTHAAKEQVAGVLVGETTTMPISSERLSFDVGLIQSAPPVSRDMGRQVSHVQIPWKTMLGIMWAAVSAVLVVRLLLSAFRVWQLARFAVPCRIKRIVAAAAAAARCVGLGRKPVVVHSRGITGPVVLGLGRVRLFIPPPDVEAVGTVDWLPIFCHELAHFRRGDGWGRLVSRLITVLLPWQPLVWLLRREYQRACEEACDDWAVAAGADPTEYAAALTQWIPRKGVAPALGAAGRSTVRRRIQRLLAQRKPPQPTPAVAWYLSTTLTAILILATVAMAQTRRPRLPRRGQSQCFRKRVEITHPQESRWQHVGSVADGDQPPHESKMISLPAYIIEPPDVVQIEWRTVSVFAPKRKSEYLVGPDGKINLHQYASGHGAS